MLFPKTLQMKMVYSQVHVYAIKLVLNRFVTRLALLREAKHNNNSNPLNIMHTSYSDCSMLWLRTPRIDFNGIHNGHDKRLLFAIIFS